METNMRHATKFGMHKNKQGFWMDGFWMDCGHFHKMPSGMRQDMSDDRFFKFMQKAMAGESQFACGECSKNKGSAK